MIKYATKKNGQIIHIKSAEKHTDYFIGEHTYIAKKGEINKHHFALKKSEGVSNLGHFSCNESLEHYNWKMYLALTKSVKLNSVEIVAAKTKTEVTVENRRIDVVFYDEKDEIICLIEVVKTNDISGEKIEDLKNYTIIRYETNKNKPRVSLIPTRAGKSAATEIESKNEKLIERTTRGRNFVHKLKFRIEIVKSDIREKESRDTNSKYSIHSTVKSIFRQKAKSIKDRAAKRRSEISYREQELEELREGIQTIPDLKRKIQILEK